MVFFGRREDALKKKQGQQQHHQQHQQQQPNKNIKKGIFAGKKGKGEVVPADDRWTLDFKKEYLDDLKRQAEESSRILERERAELARITALNKGSANAELSGLHTSDGQDTRSPKPPQLHVPDPNGADPRGRHQRAGPSAENVYNEGEIPGLGGGGGPSARPAHAHGHKQPDRGRQQRPLPKPAGAPSKHNRVREQEEPGRRGNKGRSGDNEARERQRPQPPLDPSPPPDPYHQMPPPPPYGHQAGSPPPGYGPPDAYLPPYAVPPYGQPGPPPPHMMAMMPPPPPYYAGPPSPNRMGPPGMPPPGAYGAQMYAPYPDMPPYPMPPGYMGSPTAPDGPSNHSFYPMEGQYSPGGGHPEEQGHHHHPHPHHPPEGTSSPWANMGKHAREQEEGRARHFMSGVANLYGGMDESERRRKDDARSAYVQELNEQVRQKKEAAEREKRQVREEEARKEAEIVRYVAGEAAPGAYHPQHPQHHPQHPPEQFQPPPHVSPSNGRGGRGGVPHGSVDGHMAGQIGGQRAPWEAEAAGGRGHQGQHSPPGQQGEGRARGRRVVNELRAGLSEEQQNRAAAQNDELKREWEKQREEKAAAKEREKAARRAEEEREEAEIQAYHARLEREREAEERQRREKVAEEEEAAHAARTLPRHGRRASPPPEAMVEALGAEQHGRAGGRGAHPPTVVVYNDADIPGLSGGNVPPHHAWGEREGGVGGVEEVVGEVGWQPSRRVGVAPSGRWAEAGAVPQDSEQVSSILRELREEQLLLREQVASQVETVEALKEQARAAQVERQRARAELAAVRGRMRSGGGGGGSDALDHFIVETHILPKHVNSIPEDLENMPGVEMPAPGHHRQHQHHHHPRAARPHTPDQTAAVAATAARHKEANRNRAMAIGSPAIIRGDLPSRAPPAGSRLGGKISGEPANKSRVDNKAGRRVEKAKAGAGRWK